MEPITTANVTAVATGLAKDAVKSGYDKLKSLLFGAAPEKKPELEAAIAAVEKAKADLEHLLGSSAAAQQAEVLKQAAELMKAAGNHVQVQGNQNATAVDGSKTVVVIPHAHARTTPSGGSLNCRRSLRRRCNKRPPQAIPPPWM